MSNSTLALALALVALALAAGFGLGWLARRNRAASEEPSPVPAGERAVLTPAGVNQLPASASRAPATSAPKPPASAGSQAGTPGSLLDRARSWGMQLQNLDIARAAASPFDLLVVDYSRDGSHEGALKPVEVARLQNKPDGSRRLVIAYLSVGEAESYRSYWRRDWKKQPPSWLLSENPEWEENYAVCFWDPGWQANLCGSPDACLDRILAQGFDGIYLDKCDVGEDLRHREKQAARSRPDLDADMIGLVERLAAYARDRKPGFLLVMQNAEPLIERPGLRATIDAVGKEELLYGVDAPEKANSRDETAWSKERLDMMRADGKPVFVIEYLNDRAKIAKASAALRQMGYVPYISDKSRELDKLGYRVEEA